MRAVVRAAAIFAVFVSVSACATLPQIPYDRAGAGNPKTIRVLTPAAPSRPGVLLATTVGQSFGLIGALIDAGMQSSRESDFEKIATARGFSGKDVFVRKVIAALTDGGYDASEGTITRTEHGFLKQYPSDMQGDAFLDVSMNFGYLAAGISTPYRPFVYAECKVVRASDKSVLMQRTVAYNPIGIVPEQAVTIAPDPVYEFKDFDAIMADPDRAVKGLDEAIGQVATTTATLMR
jgi:hypothetical protein